VSTALAAVPGAEGWSVHLQPPAPSDKTIDQASFAMGLSALAPASRREALPASLMKDPAAV
jgi:hypothetical protein